MVISIASGKGGTGKTTITLLLAASRDDVVVIDCDVEEPNCHLFLKPIEQKQEVVTIMVPKLDQVKCVSCGKCSEVCMFNAIAMTKEKPMLFDELCHSCGGCILSCPNHAWQESTKEIGTISWGQATQTAPNTTLLTGHLAIGVPNAGPLIKKVKTHINQAGHTLIDCPPGTACSMVAGLANSDFCVLVTEPTAFGIHDLELAIGITKLLNIPAGVVINKSDASSGDELVEELCKRNHLNVLGKIPHSQDFARQYSTGIFTSKYKDLFRNIWRQIEQAGEKR